MNSHPPDDLDTLSLDRLCAAAEEQLLLRCYGLKAIQQHKQVWKKFTEFAQTQDDGYTYSRELALRFERAFGIREDEQRKDAERWRKRIVGAIKRLDDCAHTGIITRTKVNSMWLCIPAGMHKPLREYDQYSRERRLLRLSTLRDRLHTITLFMNFLGGRGLDTLDQMQATDIGAFIVSRTTWRSSATLSRALTDLRQFFKFCFLHDILPRDFGIDLPKCQRSNLASIPSVWEPELLDKLLGAVDRASPKGKRDYAIILLAARLGMRAGDIKSLTLDNLRWDSSTIEIIQAKTGNPLVLPMSEEVGCALIDYLRAGRPAVVHRQVFLKMAPPFEPFAEVNNLYYIISYWRFRAGIKFRSKQCQGLHSLRHTLATRLLHVDTPFHVISEVLGHSSTKTTFIYAKANVEKLRTAGINTEELHHGK
ncbi:MAG: site-specific integrase [Betaproteobacteria bacterium]|nr:site-specific integrase [Betaproteobacteria bacterium]